MDSTGWDPFRDVFCRPSPKSAKVIRAICTLSACCATPQKTECSEWLQADKNAGKEQNFTLKTLYLRYDCKAGSYPALPSEDTKQVPNNEETTTPPYSIFPNQLTNTAFRHRNTVMNSLLSELALSPGIGQRSHCQHLGCNNGVWNPAGLANLSGSQSLQAGAMHRVVCRSRQIDYLGITRRYLMRNAGWVIRYPLWHRRNTQYA